MSRADTVACLDAQIAQPCRFLQVCASLIPKFSHPHTSKDRSTRNPFELSRPASYFGSSTAAGVVSNGREISALRNIRRHEKLIGVSLNVAQTSPRTAALDHCFNCESQRVLSRIRRLLPAGEIRNPIGSDRPIARIAATATNGRCGPGCSRSIGSGGGAPRPGRMTPGPA